MSKTRGLTLGKFAPLHRGHQFLIETALSETDELIVVIYDCPETTEVPLRVRADWLRTLYPGVQVVEAWDGPLEVGDTPEIKRKHEDYIRNELGIRDITHFFCSEFYGEHMSQALGAMNRVVDPSRSAVPISGTDIRRDPFASREFLHPTVYRDLITNVAFLGAPSTGKTTLAADLAGRYNTVWMPEYGREYWEHHQIERRLTLDQLGEIATGHLRREEMLLAEANRYLFTDTNALITYVFSYYYHQQAAPVVVELAQSAGRRYDLVFLCGDDIAYDDTWDRSGEANRRVFQKQILSELRVRKIPYFLLQGNLETRVRTVETVLHRFHKYANLLEIVPPQTESVTGVRVS